MHKCAQNNSVKGELKCSLYVVLQGAPEIFFLEALKIVQKGEEKDTFVAVIDGLLDSAIEGAHEGVPKDAPNDLRKDAQEATIFFESKQNVVNILNFQILLIMLAEHLWVEGRGIKTAAQHE